MRLKIKDDAEILPDVQVRRYIGDEILDLLNNNSIHESDVVIPIPKGVTNHVGEKHNYLTIIGCLGKIGNTKDMYWLSKCDCGKYAVSTYHALKHNMKKSCGCYHGSQEWHNTHIRENANRFKHGMANSRLYNIWNGMKARCSNPNTSYYHRYGGRGITVCKEWMTFEPFMEWALSHGYNDTLSIDRIDNDSNYSPANCRWATKETQANNKSTTHLITIKGVTLTATQWSKLLGTSFTNVSRWDRLGILDEKITRDIIIDCDTLQAQRNAIRPRVQEEVIVA